MKGGPLPPQATEAAGSNTIGAVFFRAIDDELQFGANTPTTDQIEIEHWHDINFTASSYNAIRYKVAVQDFNSAVGSCNARWGGHSILSVCEYNFFLKSNACIPTPTTVRLDPVRSVIMQKMSYRYIPVTGQQSLVFSLTRFFVFFVCFFLDNSII